jgi:hypothetical protein
MAISGAAASPNMGAQSSAGLSFLLTVFNVRLGWWLANPRYDPEDPWALGPHVGLFYLVNELMGRTNQENRYVYLSDGGHFENLGLYELVRRRCRYIVVCDAGEDHNLQFGDLGNAIEKCRTDFGVDIDVDIEQLRRIKGSANSTWHSAVGAIHYERVDPTSAAGVIVYMKSSLTGDEPTDVQRYAEQNPDFPHQSTAEQWFKESQFESYRALGQHIAQSTFGVIGDRAALAQFTVEQLFVQLRQRWYPPSRFVQVSFTRHTATYTALLEKIRTDAKLHFLDQQVYQEWPALLGKKPPVDTARTLPSTDEERRAGFYLCNEVIQLMEDAYLDLNLEAEYDHPDNRGWMNLFRRWSWSSMFCATWAITAGIYGARFQRFLERHLDLRPGRITLRKAIPWPLGMSKAKAKDFAPVAERDAGLDFWEATLAQLFLDHAGERLRANAADGLPSRTLETVDLVPFQMTVETQPDDKPGSLAFNVGFALVATSRDGGPARVLYFRIQDQMRKMGLGRQALRRLIEANGLRVENAVKRLSIPPGIQDRYSSAIDEAFPSAATAQEFNDLFESVMLRLRGDQRR